ncbi:nucleoside-diphosphate kinase [Candidatus Peregrinibacteria bacterium]|nr:MAG: nucleoside-diphosphate kinase [Candidatus Peregrinibacteria bacterium]
METTLVLIKPDAVQRGLIGEITTRFEKKGLRLAGMKMMQLSSDILREHYAHIADKPFFPGVESFMKSSPVIVQAWSGKDVVSTVRQLIGVTNSREALPGTIRGDFSMSMACNIIHASEDISAADDELKRFLSDAELFEIPRNEDIFYAPDER